MAYSQSQVNIFSKLRNVVVLYLYFGLICSEKESKKSEVLLCRQCGYSIVDQHEVVDIKSTLALKFKNVSVLGPKGTLVQTLRNPQGMGFDVLTVSKANIQEVGESYEEHSWFTGHSWKLAACPRCQAHLGWTFTPTDEDEGDDDDDDDEDDEEDIDMDNERPSDKYKRPKKYSFAGLILSRLIQESFADSLIITSQMYDS